MVAQTWTYKGDLQRSIWGAVRLWDCKGVPRCGRANAVAILIDRFFVQHILGVRYALEILDGADAELGPFHQLEVD